MPERNNDSLRRFRPYPAHKDSGVEWLGEVPEQWRVKRLRYAVGMNPTRKDVSGIPPDVEVSFIPMEAVGEWGGLDLQQIKLISDIGSGYTFFRDGDVVVAKITPCFENGKGALAEGLASGIGFGTTELHVLRPSISLNERFLFYLTLSHPFRKIGESTMYGAGGQKRVAEDFIRDFRQGLPPVEEQDAIAYFLDRETTRIDELVVKKERLIDLLQEKRAGLITHAVTKGLDPNVPMKDSGVEWLGEIPKHWEVKRIKWVAKMESGHTPDKKVNAYWEEGDIPWVSLNDTGYLKDHDYIDDTVYHTNQEGIANSSARLLPSSSVVFSRDATIGRCAITTRPMAVSQHFIAWICGDEVIPEYLLQVFKAMTEELERLTMGATIGTIGLPDVKILVTPVLPKQE